MANVVPVLSFCLLSLGLAASAWNSSLESHDEYLSYGEHCWGKWTLWSNCSIRCYRNRTFDLREAVSCPDHARRPGEVEYELCLGGACPISPREAGAKRTFGHSVMLRDAVLRAGLSSLTVEDFADVLGEMHITTTVLIFVTVCIAGFAKSFQILWLPDICVVIPAAAFIALRVRYNFGTAFGPAGNALVGTIVYRVMNLVLIPVSIFESAYHMQVKNFFAVFKTGILFAVVGTGLSTVMIAIMVQKTGELQWHPVSNWRESFAYAAFIADVDPVATISIFSSLKVDPVLSTLVAGEATLNDPIALVIFGVCNQRSKDMAFNLANLAEGTWFCVTLLTKSIALGLAVGLILTFLFKLLRLAGQGISEPTYLLVCAYLGYNIGDMCGLSGIIVTLFSGLVMGIYTDQLVKDKAVVDSFISTTARLADAIMFAIIGLCCFLVDDWQGVGLGLLTIAFCFIARALMLIILVPMVNIVWRRSGHCIDIRNAFMMWHSGLRGGMTVMMALMVDPYWSPNQNVLLNATIVVVIGHAYLCGCTGPFFLKFLNIPTGVPQEDGTIPLLYASSSMRFLSRMDEAISVLLNLPRTDQPPARDLVDRTLSRASLFQSVQSGTEVVNPSVQLSTWSFHRFVTAEPEPRVGFSEGHTVH